MFGFQDNANYASLGNDDATSTGALGLSFSPPIHNAAQLPPRKLPASSIRIVMLVSVALNALLLGCDSLLALSQSHHMPWRGIRPVYSPVDEAIRYEHKSFPGLLDTTVYGGSPPTSDTDAAWDKLYAPYGISLVDNAHAARLVSKTAESPEVPGRHMVAVHFIHQLHCLNFLRMLAFPDRYAGIDPAREAKIMGAPVDHVDHCLNAIREIIMCNADISPNVWLWNDERQRSEVRFDTVHGCRSFETIQGWLDGHRTLSAPQTENLNMSWRVSHHH